MGADQHFDWPATAASALDWWCEAGVDTLVDAVPHDWFAAEPRLAAPREAAPLATTAEPEALPDTIEAFVAWRTSAAAPEAPWRGTTVAASGPVDAAIMVLADCPDGDDGAAGVLMTGEVGMLFDRMLAAIGLSRDTVHLAAVCAKRPVAGRMPREIEARLGEIARHHVALGRPTRLLCLGNAASRAILGTDMPANRGNLHRFNHRSGQTGVVASFHPRLLLEKPALKAEAWKDLQLLMRGLT